MTSGNERATPHSGRATVSPSRGFTLIEIIVAVAILALLIGLIQGIYATAAKNRKSAETSTAAYHSGATLLQRMTDELAMSFIPVGNRSGYEFRSSSDNHGVANLEFVTHVPTVAGIRAGGDVKIYYELVRDPNAEDRSLNLLRRTEYPDPNNSDTRGSFTYDWSSIRRFTVECYDPVEQRWVQGWDSNLRSANSLLPQAVRLELSWGPQESETVVRTAIPIYGVL